MSITKWRYDKDKEIRIAVFLINLVLIVGLLAWAYPNYKVYKEFTRVYQVVPQVMPLNPPSIDDLFYFNAQATNLSNPDRHLYKFFIEHYKYPEVRQENLGAIYSVEQVNFKLWLLFALVLLLKFVDFITFCYSCSKVENRVFGEVFKYYGMRVITFAKFREQGKILYSNIRLSMKK